MDLFFPLISRSQAHKNPLSVLLIEDSPLIQLIHKMMLAHLGCLVEAVGRGEDALVLLRQHHYDLILLDIGLPGMSGIEVISEFYQHKMQPKTKAIAVTTLNDAETLQKCYAVGIKQVLHKPLEMDELVRVIHEVKAELSIV